MNDVVPGVPPTDATSLRRFAFGWVLVLTALLILGTKESARFNLVGVWLWLQLGWSCHHVICHHVAAQIRATAVSTVACVCVCGGGHPADPPWLVLFSGTSELFNSGQT